MQYGNSSMRTENIRHFREPLYPIPANFSRRSCFIKK